MKHSMQALFPLMLLILSMNTSCKKQASFMNEGVITGFDSRTCPCCGGLVINFKGVLQSYSGQFYLIENNPAEFGIDASTTFPVRVKVDWTQDRTMCITGAIGNIIRITRFKKI